MEPPEHFRLRTRSRDPLIIREEVLRPSRYLGYDRDEMGRYFLGREAFALAESQFRRAVYLNPFEPVFKIHWAAALAQLNRKAEAHDLLVQVFRSRQDDATARQMWHHFWPSEPFPEADAAPPNPTHESADGDSTPLREQDHP